MADVNDWNTKIIEEFRTNEGKVGGQFDGAPLLLLTTTGRKSGTPRTSPMMYLDDGAGRWLVFASKAGADTDPDWFLNLAANPDVVVEIGTDRIGATAETLQGEERDRWYAEQSRRYPGFADYQSKTERVIPVVALTPEAVSEPAVLRYAAFTLDPSGGNPAGVVLDLALVTPPARLTLHQGHDLGRPSVIVVDLVPTDRRVRVTGHAVPIP